MIDINIFREPTSNLLQVLNRPNYMIILIVILSFISAILYKGVYIAMFYKFAPGYQYSQINLIIYAIKCMPLVFNAFILYIYAEKRDIISRENKRFNLFIKYFPLIILLPAFINAHLFNVLLVCRLMTTYLVFWLITSISLDFKNMVLKQGKSDSVIWNIILFSLSYLSAVLVFSYCDAATDIMVQ
ncbi:hypothetical protein NF27_HL00100 [Candidatus Jidaibacter acanthamoeba]|uniref:Yip1 domain-containing protein n=1 Tax=Candidatus Jidaibacter acanthamoebae TaxID=86105 RepID=A0A0C1QX17_9RICK|nr:hypothetical protein NF27_HL00100 [Candidatus Jidaibacter acanthamoeba]